ncbi:PREDICTED: EPIDERMAL PATTERNING FACTOR-like protein 2 [Nelumbo nucifera]|uniref:Epidermal patterning factor-like protein n=2 Tax=Nelumbo nucifera TaxID=4432 RepID=A0A822Z5E6_NELNU|nr:PREDICTED: EPIDERMAL PATTERNING FACTOR-like protein 2 [Nelumbo nucifera]DAD41604.1 TPA_asm: hypothetical protein HUJ06_015927 [Nelumbo nucifera]
MSSIQFARSDMGYSHNCVSRHMYRHFVISLLFLLVSSSTQLRSMAEGREIFRLVEDTQMNSEEKTIVRAQIGSRPPRCERRCSSCGHCEAVQVPVVPQFRSGSRHSSKVSSVAFFRGVDNSNYKPMSWKCKCGDMIFNP